MTNKALLSLLLSWWVRKLKCEKITVGAIYKLYDYLESALILQFFIFIFHFEGLWSIETFSFMTRFLGKNVHENLSRLVF